MECDHFFSSLSKYLYIHDSMVDLIRIYDLFSMNSLDNKNKNLITHKADIQRCGRKSKCVSYSVLFCFTIKTL